VDPAGIGPDAEDREAIERIEDLAGDQVLAAL
jgi:hypothetical protein